MQINQLIEATKQFKSAEEKVAFFIGFHCGKGETPPVMEAMMAPPPAPEPVAVTGPIPRLKRRVCENCGKKFVPNPRKADQKFCPTKDNPVCHKDRNKKMAHDAYLRDKQAREDHAKAKQITVPPRPQPRQPAHELDFKQPTEEQIKSQMAQAFQQAFQPASKYQPPKGYK